MVRRCESLSDELLTLPNASVDEARLLKRQLPDVRKQKEIRSVEGLELAFSESCFE